VIDPPSPIVVDAVGRRFSIGLKAWETEFFGRTFGSLSWETAEPGPFPFGPAADAFRSLGRAADAAGYRVVECHSGIGDFAAAAALEHAGFRLVDSRMRFVTRLTVDGIPDTRPSLGCILDASPAHRDRIIELTHEGFTHNDRFTSRFKNPEYFSLDESRRYYEAWIDNSAFGEGSASAVFEVDGRIAGYFVYQESGTRDGLPVMKGILAAVEPAHRGANAHLAMQVHVYRKLGFDEWYVDNTTQLTNLPVIRNHMRSGKHLEEVVLTFYRTAGS
jgi:hypothetical protein